MGRILGPGGPRLGGLILSEALVALAPVFLVPIAAVLVSLFAQQAITFSGDKIVPKLDRISLLADAKRKFGAAGFVEFAKAAVKLAAVATALFIYLARDLDRMIGAATAEARVVGGDADAVARRAPHHHHRHRRDHRRHRRRLAALRACPPAPDVATRTCARRRRQSDGDPHMKAQRRSRAEAIATNRMLLDVPKADVVIVNPTHFAVALKWTRAKGTAPVCVAKGEGEVALRIREVAETAGIPLHSDPPTARALFATVEIGREIAPEHYRAVAAAIRFSERMRRAARARGGGMTPAALRRLAGLAEARRARDLARLDGSSPATARSRPRSPP